MATKIYLQSSGTAIADEANLKGSLEAQNVHWGQTMIYGPDFQIFPIKTTPQGTTMTTFSRAGTSASGDQIYYMGYAAQLDGAYTFDSSVTVEFVWRASESSLSANFNVALDVIVVQPSFSGGSWNNSGAFVSNFWAAGEPATTLTARHDAGNTFGGSYTTSSGDWLLVSVCMFKNSSNNFTGSVSLGDDAVTDLAGNDTDTDADNPWVEFSLNLGFLSDDPPEPSGNTNRLMMMGVGT